MTTTMRHTIRILIISAALLSVACEKDDTIFTELSVRLVMPDSRPVERLGIITDYSYFENINSYEKIPFPDVEQNNATLRIRKGVYRIFIEADVTYPAGEERRVRCTDYNQTSQSVTLVGDTESLVLLLKTI